MRYIVPWPLGVRGRYGGKPLPAPSANSRVDWRTKMQQTRRLRTHFAEHALAARNLMHVPAIDKANRERRSVRLTRLIGYRGQTMDEDNVRGALKPCLDALRDAGWIWQDSPNWIDLEVRQLRAKDRIAAVMFEISDARHEKYGG